MAEAERQPVSKIGFTFEDGSIAARLTLIASKCRRREVRLWAISLNKRLSWREGVWDAKTLLCDLGVVVLEGEARNSRAFVKAKDRVRWYGVSWDRERRLVIVDGIHVMHVPDGEGGMRTRRVALDVDRWEPETVDEGVGMPVALSPDAGGSAGGSVVGSIMSVPTRLGNFPDSVVNGRNGTLNWFGICRPIGLCTSMPSPVPEVPARQGREAGHIPESARWCRIGQG